MSLARVRALIIFGVLVVVAVVIVTWTIASDDQGSATKAVGRQCDKDEPRAHLTIPTEQDISLNVYNSTDRVDLAASTAQQLRGVKFHILKVAQDPTGAVIKGTAQIRYGYKEVGAAQLVAAYVPDAQLAFDPNRENTTVDLVLGQAYSDIRNPTDVKQALIDLGVPSPPPGTC